MVWVDNAAKFVDTVLIDFNMTRLVDTAAGTGERRGAEYKRICVGLVW